MKFNKIVILDQVNLSKDSIEELGKYSENKVTLYLDDPLNEAETIQRIGNAECILVSWKTKIDENVLDVCSNLKFIGICGTNSNYIDLDQCTKRNVVVSNVRDYGDEGVVEWIVFELIKLLRGFGKYQWRNEPQELSGKTIGILGLGAVGKLLADAALGLKMNVLYFSRTRNLEFEKKGLVFCDKKLLLEKSDIIALQTPRDLKILNKEDFDLMQGKILVNNTLGKAFDESDFIEWIKKEDNYAIMDMVSDFGSEFKDLDRVIYSDFISGKTKEFVDRLSKKTLDNVKGFLEGNVVNRIS